MGRRWNFEGLQEEEAEENDIIVFLTNHNHRSAQLEISSLCPNFSPERESEDQEEWGVCVCVSVCQWWGKELSHQELATGTKQFAGRCTVLFTGYNRYFWYFPLEILGKSVGNSCEMFTFKKRKKFVHRADASAAEFRPRQVGDGLLLRGISQVVN